MSGIHKRIELISNIAIILVAVMIGVIVVQKFVRPSKSAPPPPTIAVGSKVELAGVDWSKNHKTVVLALQKGCHFCTESAPFYKQLVEAATLKGVKIVAVLPQSGKDAQDYLTSIAVPISEIRQSALNSLNVSGTPTLILVDDKGQVAASWVGKLPTAKEAEVLAAL